MIHHHFSKRAKTRTFIVFVVFRREPREMLVRGLDDDLGTTFGQFQE
jgi:hypothetical protein